MSIHYNIQGLIHQLVDQSRLNIFVKMFEAHVALITK